MVITVYTIYDSKKDIFLNGAYYILELIVHGFSKVCVWKINVALILIVFVTSGDLSYAEHVNQRSTTFWLAL